MPGRQSFLHCCSGFPTGDRMSLLLVVVICACVNNALGDNLTQERTTLTNQLLANYNADVIPSGLNGAPLIVNHSLYVVHVISLEDNVLKFQGWQGLTWYDARFRWDPSKYGGVKKLFISAKKLWRPDIVLVNSAREFTSFKHDDMNAVVFQNGMVTFDPQFFGKSVCELDESKLYTNNEVVCGLQFMSWAYDGHMLDLHLHSASVDRKYIERRHNSKWKYVKSSAKRRSNLYDLWPAPFIDLQYDITLQGIA